MSIDEEMLSFIKGGITEYATTTSGLLPLYVSEIFKDILSEGQILTDERTGDQYEIVGYIPTGAKWVEEDDLIRFPLISLKGWFIAPFTEQSRNDIMTQLSSLHNTYILLSDSADINFLKSRFLHIRYNMDLKRRLCFYRTNIKYISQKQQHLLYGK